MWRSSIRSRADAQFSADDDRVVPEAIRKLGMLQTPHHFYSPDPFERNLGQFRVIPNEGELFYGIVQDGNDFWNATFFCGSCAVLRRTALDEIGGIAAETVTEDAHTSPAHADARLEHGVHQHSAGGGPGDGAAERRT